MPSGVVVRRREFISLLGGAAAGFPLTTRAQERMSRIGILLIGGSEPMGPFYEALRARGYVEGRNIQLVVRSAQGDANRLPQLATELVGGRVDVIVASLTPSAIAWSGGLLQCGFRGARSRDRGLCGQDSQGR
jgi:putative ABC transport system substrate-binding protein